MWAHPAALVLDSVRLDREPDDSAGYLDLLGEEAGQPRTPAQRAMRSSLVAAVYQRGWRSGLNVAYIERHCPPGQLADTRGAEAGIARACWTLAGWEEAYRAGQQLSDDTAKLYRAPNTPTVESLLAAAPGHAVDELTDLAGQLRTGGIIERLRAAAGDPAPGQRLGVAAPVFVPHWADGDLLVGDTLLDCKTVVSLRDPAKVTTWLFQLLSYAWLDVTDHFHIRSVGLYFARHGVLVTWPLDELTDRLLAGGDAAASKTKEQWLALAARVITAEGAHPPWIGVA